MPATPSLTAVIVHAALILGIVMFGVVAHLAGTALPPLRVALPGGDALHLWLLLIGLVPFGASIALARRLPAPLPGATRDDWWRANLGRAVLIWALIEGSTLLGLVAYLLTRNTRVLLVSVVGLLLFATFRPSRLAQP
jgi:hypothetical protein